MQKLVTTNEACDLLGISLQGIHYRIKKGLLKSIKKDGKVYVYIEEANENQLPQTKQNETLYLEMLKLKDEEIILLKQMIDWLKTKYENEIVKLEKSQQQMNEIINNQTQLLNQSFLEIKEIINQKFGHNVLKQTLTPKEFFVKMKKLGLSELLIKEIVIDKIATNDERFVYDSLKKEIFIKNCDFSDLLEEYKEVK